MPPPRLIPTIRYRDAEAAIAWLCEALGFERHAVYADNGVVHHAQLRFGPSMIMLSSATDDAFGKLQVPAIKGEAVTQSTYLIVADADAHYAHALAHGAEIVYELRSEDYGGRGYSCRDPQGQLWSIGTYDPFAI